MRRVEILPGLETSVLGFGCAPILGSVDGKTASAAVTKALDLGITHFDLARSYGYGKAEKFVGGLLRGKRGEVTIATKFGIEATELASLLAPLKPLLRAVKRQRSQCRKEAGIISQPSPPDSRSGAKLADYFHRRVPLTPRAMRSSLEKSLKEIGTDYVDFFLIHEPPSMVFSFKELVMEADQLKQEGKIRAFGLALMRERFSDHELYLNTADLLQFNNSPSSHHYAETLSMRADLPNIFFSPFRNAYPQGSCASILKKITADFPKSITLCSMFNPRHIQENAAAIIE